MKAFFPPPTLELRRRQRFGRARRGEPLRGGIRQVEGVFCGAGAGGIAVGVGRRRRRLGIAHGFRQSSQRADRPVPLFVEPDAMRFEDRAGLQFQLSQ